MFCGQSVFFQLFGDARVRHERVSDPQSPDGQRPPARRVIGGDRAVKPADQGVLLQRQKGRSDQPVQTCGVQRLDRMRVDDPDALFACRAAFSASDSILPPTARMTASVPSLTRFQRPGSYACASVSPSSAFPFGYRMATGPPAESANVSMRSNCAREEGARTVIFGSCVRYERSNTP